MALVSLEQVKAHLRLTSSEDDADLTLRLSMVEELVLDYVAQRRSDTGSPTWADTVSGWTDATAPDRVKGAILLEVGQFYRFRGDDAPNEAPSDAHLSPLTRRLLDRLKDPTVA